MSGLSEFESRFDVAVRRIFTAMLGPGGEPEFFELLDEVICHLEKQGAAVGGDKKFPYRHVAIRLCVAGDHVQGSFHEAIARRVRLAREVRRRLEERGVECPHPLRMDLQLVCPADWPLGRPRWECSCFENPTDPPGLLLTVIEGSRRQTVELYQRVALLGRDGEVRDRVGRLLRRNTVALDNPGVSRIHARIEFVDEAAAYRLFDDANRHTTSILREGKAIDVPGGSAGGAWLRSGDLIHLGPVRVLAEVVEEKAKKKS
jgi:hypothetical protein